jgi:hypothetical protein
MSKKERLNRALTAASGKIVGLLYAFKLFPKLVKINFMGCNILKWNRLQMKQSAVSLVGAVIA